MSNYFEKSQHPDPDQHPDHNTLTLAKFLIFFPNYSPPDHNLGQILNSDPARSYFPLKILNDFRCGNNGLKATTWTCSFAPGVTASDIAINNDSGSDTDNDTASQQVHTLTSNRLLLLASNPYDWPLDCEISIVLQWIWYFGRSSPGWVGLLLFSVICRLCQLFEQLSKHAIPFMIDDTVSTQFFLGKKSLHRFLCLVAWNASLKSYGQANLCHFCDDIVKTVLNNIKNMSFSSLMGWQTYNFCSPSSGW